MDYTLALLLSLLHLLAMSTAAPLSAEVVKMKSKVRRQAEQLVVKLNDFQVPAGWPLSPSDDGPDGPTAIVTVLEGYSNLISDSLHGVAQVRAEISSLTGYLDNWKKGHCSEQRPKPALPGALQELQSRKTFIHTVSIEALMRVKEFLNLLLKNLDHLETCQYL